MTDTLPGVEPKVAVSVVQDIADGGASIRWDWVVSDLSVNYAGPRGLLPSAGDCSGRAQQPRITPEDGNVLAQFFSWEELFPLVARLIRSTQQENPVEEKVPPGAEVRWQQIL